MRKDWYFWRLHFIWRKKDPLKKNAWTERGFLTWTCGDSDRTWDFFLKRGLFTISYIPKDFWK